MSDDLTMLDDRPASYISNVPQGLAHEPPGSLHILACPRIALRVVLPLFPERYIVGQQTNPPHACCRNIDNIDVEAWYSCPEDEARHRPDIYKFYCNECMRCHVRFCVGGNHPDAKKYTVRERPDLYDSRPFWQVR